MGKVTEIFGGAPKVPEPPPPPKPVEVTEEEFVPGVSSKKRGQSALSARSTLLSGRTGGGGNQTTGGLR